MTPHTLHEEDLEGLWLVDPLFPQGHLFCWETMVKITRNDLLSLNVEGM
jgi:hypothetical protein